MVRKVFRSGNSYVVSLPTEAVKQLAITEGSEVDITLDSEGRRLVITPIRPSGAEITPEYARKVADFIAAYRPALEALSDR